MNLHFHDLIPPYFSPASRVWIYQCNRQFCIDETKGFGSILFGQFILLMADETTGVSGCSTDSSVRLIKAIEEDYNVKLFERTNLAFIVEERIQLMPLSRLNEAIKTGIITDHTLYFDNNIQTKNELINSWIIPLNNSWLANRISIVQN